MSIHCLICGHQGNWRDDGEYNEDNTTWTVMRLFPDYLVPKPKKKAIEEWWVHTDCLKKFITERTEAESRLKTTVKRLS